MRVKIAKVLPFTTIRSDNDVVVIRGGCKGFVGRVSQTYANACMRLVAEDGSTYHCSYRDLRNIQDVVLQEG